ncbi:MAG: VWA domain-containing protein [Acidobacteria bacterium]|nr:VWA domain-containing protein [Acidobacteriota bacterium]
MRRAFLGLVLGLAWLAVPDAQQTPPAELPPTFRAGVDLVTLDVSVLDDDRRPVRGLTARDFTVLERGTPLPIVAFNAVDVPERHVSAAAWLHEVAPDVVSNRFEPDRLIVLLLDDWNVAVNPADVLQAKRIAHAIVDELGRSDYAAVIYTFSHEKGQEFTTDVSRIREAIDRFTSSRPALPEPPPSMACPHNECVTATLRAVSDFMRDSWPGRRKAIAYISPEGNYTTGPQSIGGVDGMTKAGDSAALWDSGPDLERTFRALQRANVNVYQYDTRGLADSLGIDISPNTSSVMGMFADNTGGRIVTRTNAPDARVSEMLVETGSYYMLGVEPPSSGSDGFRRVEVRVSHPGVTVRTRSGYYSGSNTKSAPAKVVPTALDNAMAGARPVGDLPLSLTAAPFATPAGAAVAVVAGLDRGPDAPAREVIDIAVRAFSQATGDRRSKGVATTKLELTRRPTAADVVHYDLGSRLDLAPGRYEIRLAADSSATGRAGSAFVYVTVPDFAREALSASGLVLTRVPASRASGSDPLAALLPFTPTTARTFGAHEQAAAVLRLYQSSKDAGAIAVTARLRDEADRVVFERAETVNVDGGQPTVRTAEYRLELPLAELEPGEYLLQVQAAAGPMKTGRQIRFHVE